MANPTPPEPPRRLEPDEWIAIFVTLATLGGLGVWILGAAGLRRIAPSQIAGIDIPGLAQDEEGPPARRDESEDRSLFGLRQAPPTLTGRERTQARPGRVPRRQRTEEEETPRRAGRRAEQEGRRRSPRRLLETDDSSDGLALTTTGLILGQQAQTFLDDDETAGTDPETDATLDNGVPPVVPPVTQDPAETEVPEEMAGVPSPDEEETAAEVRPDINDDVGDPINFVDVDENHWARAYIDAMSARGLIGGVEADRFAPDEPVTRAQYAQLVERVFQGDEDVREGLDFVDLDDDYWAASAIGTSVRWGFLSGYPGLEFRPERSISRLEVLLSLRAGLNLSEPDDPAAILEAYGDRDAIPDWARPPVSAAVQAELERNRPDSEGLDLEREASRAEVTAMFYQALVRAGQAEPLP
ncbi:S-layer homology domain-containing protein [Sodalinema gerasimenkoae]|uniref:S-layer homology domain-containing protein n=1 Tax=Sodalinema gerasimenkoae TaxID=2862348 RepID=UPI001359B4BC|nr:S-layer homology domain-containing protein [Sodalinema gerasimenkoae]